VRAQGFTSAAVVDRLSALFDQTCTIRQNEGTTADAAGQPTPDWQALTGHVGLACRIAPVSALASTGQSRRAEMVVDRATHIIVLPGPYPDVTTAMRAVVGSTSYQIVRIVRDSEQLLCELEVELVTT